MQLVYTHEVASDWNFKDFLGSVKVRSLIGRNDYKVEPGLYKIGNPDANSDVFVSANYKLSFDILRRSLKGINAWILTLDTKGVNVWCAAGKETFGSDELIKRIKTYRLSEIVSHKRLILPQLGAPGISSHIVKKETGFHIKYGPVRATDIKQYINNGYKATESMRRVKFNISDRLLIVPVEIMNSLLNFFLLTIFFIGLSGFSKSGFSLGSMKEEAFKTLVILISAYFSGTVFTPSLLPWIPTKYFSSKGIIIQSLVFIILMISGYLNLPVIIWAAWYLMTIAISSFLAMNFTGASTFTSLSGVNKEMKIFIPIQLTSYITGFLLLIISKFVL